MIKSSKSGYLDSSELKYGKLVKLKIITPSHVLISYPTHCISGKRQGK